jgi:hypothetical protein
MNSAAVDPKVEEQGMTDKQGETADAEVGDDFKYDQARVLSWVDPERVRRMMDGLTGLEVNEAIRDGRLPEPTLSRVLGIRCVAVSEGEVSAELMPREDLECRGRRGGLAQPVVIAGSCT